MSALNPTAYQPGDEVAIPGHDGLERFWRRGFVRFVTASGRVFVAWTDGAIGNYAIGDANLRRVEDIPPHERTWLTPAERNCAIRREAADRLEAAAGAWVHSDSYSRAILAAMVTDLADLNSVACMGCDLAARRLLGIDAVGDDDLAAATDGGVA